MLNTISGAVQSPVNSGGSLQSANEKIAVSQKNEPVQQDEQNKIQPRAAEASSTQETSAQADQTAASVDVYAAADQAKSDAQAQGQNEVARGSVVDISA